MYPGRAEGYRGNSDSNDKWIIIKNRILRIINKIEKKKIE